MKLVIIKKLKLFALAALLLFSANLQVLGHGYHQEEEIQLEQQQIILEKADDHDEDSQPLLI